MEEGAVQFSGETLNWNIIYLGKTAHVLSKTAIILSGNLAAKLPAISSDLLCVAISSHLFCSEKLWGKSFAYRQSAAV